MKTDPLRFIVALASTLALLIYAISFLRKRNSREIYAIWYITSLFFLIFLGLGVAAKNNDITIPVLCGPYEKGCWSLLEYFADMRHEVIFVCAFAGVALGPQLLTYLLSGLSGSASTPKLVWQIEKIAVWSLIKFIAGLGGIVLADPAAAIIAGKQNWIYAEYLPGFMLVTAAFSLAAVEDCLTSTFPMYIAQSQSTLGILGGMHRFFTRNR